MFTVPLSRLAELEAIGVELDWRPVRIGTTVEGVGISAGARRIDGAAVRNLAETHRRDARAYLAALCRMQP